MSRSQRQSRWAPEEGSDLEPPLRSALYRLVPAELLTSGAAPNLPPLMILGISTLNLA
jgi:hypothetical protein